jgi:Bacterial Ig-like domain (group 3)/Putative Ig domain
MIAGREARRVRCFVVAVVASVGVFVALPGSALAALSWSPPASVDVGNALSGVACPSGSVCVAVDSTGHEVTFDPASPGGATPAPIDSGVELTGVACWLTSACAAIGDDGDEIDFDPGAPGSATRAAIGAAGHVSCVVPATTPQQCTLVDGGEEITFNPASPGSPSPTTIDGANFLSAVACPSASQCTAVDQLGQAITFNPASPAPATTTIDNGVNGELDDVACPSASQCTAVDSAGRAVTFDPQSPTSPAPTVTQIDTNPDDELEGIACSSASACVVEDVDGNVVEGDPMSGVAWTATPIAPSTLLTGIACGSSTVCVAVDASGHVYTGTPTSTPAPPAAAPLFTADTPPGLSAAKFYGIGSDITDAASSPAYRFAASGSPAPAYAVSSGALPTGMALNPSTGFLTGTPTVGGQAYTFTVTASNGVAPAAVSASITGTVGAQGACATVVPGSPNEFTSLGTIAVTNTVHGISASVAQIVGDPVSQRGLTVTTNFGPGTIDAGPNGDCVVSLLAGQEDVNVELDYAQTIVEESPATSTATTVTVNPTSSSSGQSVTYNASVAPSSPDATDPSGTVAFTATTGSATADLCTATLSSGSGSCMSGSAPLGTDTITATYSGDNTFAGSAGTTTETVTGSAGPAPVGTTGPGPVGSAAPVVKGCPAATGKVTRSALGLLELGDTRARARNVYAKSTYRKTKYQDFFCLTPIGIRVGYGSPALLKILPADQRKRLTGRAVWASTTNSFYAIRGVRVGTLITRARKALKLTGPIRVGRNTWYLAHNQASTAVFKTRGRTITEIGIANKTLSTDHKRRVALLKSFT